jgi:hypothetical protein
MSDAIAYRDQLVDWVYEQAGGVVTESVPIMAFTESVGLNSDGAYTLLRYCRDEGLLDDRTSGMGNPCALLTSYGMADVLARRKRRVDPAQRARACRTALLRWFYDQRIAQVHMPITEEFAQDASKVWEGIQFTDIEIQDAAEYLSDKALIDGVSVPELRGPVRAQITTEGIDCVTDWDGNVAEYLRDQRGYGPTINHGPEFHGRAQGQHFAWGNRDVTQHQVSEQVAPGFEPLAEAVAEILKQLPAFGLDPDDQQDAEEAAGEVLGEVTQPRPEPRRVRKMVATLRGFLVPIAASAARQEVQELAQHGIDKLNHAIGM